MTQDTQAAPVTETTTFTPAQERLNQWAVEVAKLDKWENHEIDHCVNELHKMLRKWQSSAALAITKVMLEIAIKEGQ